MTKKEAIAKVMKSGNWTESEAISIVNNEIRRNPDYLEKVKLVDVEKFKKKYKEPIQGMDILDWTPTKVDPGPDTAKIWGDLGKDIERAAGIAFPGGKETGEQTPGELLEEIEKGSKFDPSSSEFDDDAWFEDYSYLNREEPKEETEEEGLQRHIEQFNEMRSHVSDLDEDYLLNDTPKPHWEMGDEQMPDERELTQIVEALQRQAMQQGSPAQTAGIPLGMDGQSILPQNPMDQQLRDMSGVGRQAQQLQNTPQQADLMELQRQMQMKAMENIRMQTLAAGGGQGIGRQMSWDRWQ